jgi:hypothetical protein
MKLKINFGLVILSIFFVIIFVDIFRYFNKQFGYMFDTNDRMLRTSIENFDSKVQQQQQQPESQKQIVKKSPPIDDSNIPEVKFPFKNCRDENGKRLNVIMISAPFRTSEDEQSYAKYKKEGLNFCGISSYLDFPDKIKNPSEDRFHEKQNHDYINMVTTLLHCFRQIPTILANSGLPMELITEADLKDTDGYYKPDPNIQKEYDFMYVCLDDDESPQSKCIPGWQWYNRNWDLAKMCLTTMCRDFHLKGIIVGRTNCEFTNYCSGIVKTVPFMDFFTFQKEMQKCKFLFVPNISDASPRVMTEAMCYNIPVLANYNIIGGWHNVIPGVTGEFFTNENDITPALQKITEGTYYTPREWYCANRGRNNYGKKLAEFLKTNYPNLNNPNVEYADI